MLVVKTSVSSGYELTLLNNLYNADNNFRIGNSAPLSISIFGKTFHSVNGILDWISRFLEGQVYINIQIDIVIQLSQFLCDGLKLCLVILKVVCIDKLFALYKLTIVAIADLLELLEIYVEVDKKLCNWSSESLNTINISWEIVTAEQIAGKRYFNQTLKLIVQLVWQVYVINLDTVYLIVNTQAVYRLKKCKNRYALRQFLTLDDQLKIKDALVPIYQLTLEELVSIGVYINLDDKI